MNVVTEMGQWWAGYVWDTLEASFFVPMVVDKEEEAKESPSFIFHKCKKCTNNITN
jgi:hypothetical protein